jgi:crotonobetainyl-CoA:carnitine CoA-transferase CaiB-like acyl-CoA transferase
MVDAIGLPELKDDPRFARNADRTAHHADLEKILAAHFATRTRAFWLEKLEGASVPCAPIANVEEVTQNSHLKEHRMILQADHPSYEGLIVPGTPLRNPDSTATPDTRAPKLGEHTDEVLAALLGLDKTRLADLRARSII